MSQICQRRLSIWANKKYTVENLPKTCKLLPKWQKFAKSGHTDHGAHTWVEIVASPSLLPICEANAL